MNGLVNDIGEMIKKDLIVKSNYNLQESYNILKLKEEVLILRFLKESSDPLKSLRMMDKLVKVITRISKAVFRYARVWTKSKKELEQLDEAISEFQRMLKIYWSYSKKNSAPKAANWFLEVIKKLIKVSKVLTIIFGFSAFIIPFVFFSQVLQITMAIVSIVGVVAFLTFMNYYLKAVAEKVLKDYKNSTRKHYGRCPEDLTNEDLNLDSYKRLFKRMVQILLKILTKIKHIDRDKKNEVLSQLKDFKSKVDFI